MSGYEWAIVLGINGIIVLFGLWKSRETQESTDWFLAARGLPWWMVGLSMFATAVDSGDYVAVAGGAYQQGLPYLSTWWIALTIGWLLMTWIVLVPMYRSGMFTNSEYLEHRFGPTARVIAVFIQLQTRTNVLANVAFSLYLTFDTLTGWETETWWLVVAIATLAAAYTAMGGLRSVAITDCLQSVVMLGAAVILWAILWTHVDGWSGLESRLQQQVRTGQLSAADAYAMTHVGGSTDPQHPPWLVVVGFILVMTSYCVINQSQAMRMLASRSKWDLRMAAVVAAGITCVVLWFNVTLGIMGRAVVPDLATGDRIFPYLISEFLKPVGSTLTGLVVAGLLAGGISTYDSIGSALASVFTRDVYARFLVRRASDHHYVRVSRIVTFCVIAISFAYIPFLEVGMVTLYLRLVGVAVIPLMTVYLVGVLTTASRSSGTIGLLVGIALGLSRFADPLTLEWFGEALPIWWTGTFWGYLWSTGLTAITMGLVTLVQGPADRAEIGPMMFTGKVTAQSNLQKPKPTESLTWLEASTQRLSATVDYPFEVSRSGPRWYQRTEVWTILLLIIVGTLNLFVFW